MKKVKELDTTLRDGRQRIACGGNLVGFLRIADKLDELGVDTIEAGFPISGVDNSNIVEKVAARVKFARVVGLARCARKDIKAVFDAVKNAKKKGFHIFCATSDSHIAAKFAGKSFDDIEKTIVEALEYANELVASEGGDWTIQFSAEDASSTPVDRLIRIGNRIAGKAQVFNLPDTIGRATPKRYGKMFADVKAGVKAVRDGTLVLSAHCHNDKGLAVANSLAAVENGALQVEGTILGIGERAGNTCLTTFAMALADDVEEYGAQTGIKLDLLHETAQVVSNVMGVEIPPTHPFHGEYVFGHASGIHQHVAHVYTWCDPARIGRKDGITLRLTNQSGRHGLKQVLSQLHLPVTDEQFDELFTAFKTVADTKPEVTDQEIEALWATVTEQTPGYQLVDVQITSGTGAPTATVTIVTPTGETKRDSAVGDGPVDAALNALRKLTNFIGTLSDYRVRARAHGQGAVGEAHLVFKVDGELVPSRASDKDTNRAMVQATVVFVNRMLRKAGNGVVCGK